MSIGAGAVKAASLPRESAANSLFGTNSEFAALSRGNDGGTKTSAIEVLRAELGDSVRVVNERLAHRGQSLDIGVDPSTGAVVVKVSDDKTGEIVRQIPSEDALRVARNIEVLTGILVDHKE